MDRDQARTAGLELEGEMATSGIGGVGTGGWTRLRSIRLAGPDGDGVDVADLTVGVLEINDGLERLDWVGSGPHETYPDRKRSGVVGRWLSTVTDQHVPYVRPQESGGHADVRRLTLRDPHDAARGLRLVLDRPRQVSVLHLRAADLAAATHDVEVRPRPETIVALDAAHRGLGTASCGPDTLPEYRMGAGTYRWAWALLPLDEA